MAVSQAAERADRAPRFPTPTVGELGRATRRSPPVQQAGPIEWDDNDPDMMEPPQMIDSPFRFRRRPREGYSGAGSAITLLPGSRRRVYRLPGRCAPSASRPGARSGWMDVPLVSL